jgi:hypothetical protein
MGCIGYARAAASNPSSAKWLNATKPFVGSQFNRNVRLIWELGFIESQDDCSIYIASFVMQFVDVDMIPLYQNQREAFQATILTESTGNGLTCIGTN